MGLSELLVVLLSVAGFGVEPNPQAPAAAEVLKYAPGDADYFVYLDAQAVVPANYRLLGGLRDRAAIKRNPRLRGAVDAVINEVETIRSAAKGMLGLDPVSDVKSLAAWVKVPDAGEPTFLVVVRGNFPADAIEKIGTALGTAPQTVAGKPMLSSPDGDVAIARAGDGSLMAGSPPWIKARLSARFAPARRNALTAGAAPVLDGKPFLAVASAPSAAALRAIRRELKDPEAAFAVDLLTGHSFAAVAMSHDGVGWTATLRDAKGLDRAALLSEGALSLMRSFHHGSRGFARAALAVLPSYAGATPEIAELLAHRDELLALVDTTTGDGNFTATVDKDPRARRVTVKATARELSQVLPAAGLLPLGGAAAWLMLGVGVKRAESAPARTVAPPPAKARKAAPPATSRAP